MADRYWIGGSGNVNDTAHWSASSGGSGGASAPGSSDVAIIDSNSGGGTITVNVTTTWGEIQSEVGYPWSFINTEALTIKAGVASIESFGTGAGELILDGTITVAIVSSYSVRVKTGATVDGIVNIDYGAGGISGPRLIVESGATTTSLNCLSENIENASTIGEWQLPSSVESTCTGMVTYFKGAEESQVVNLYGADYLYKASEAAITGDIRLGAGGVTYTAWFLAGATLAQGGNIGTLKINDINDFTYSKTAGTIANLVVLACSGSKTHDFGSTLAVTTSINVLGDNNLTLTGASGAHNASVKNLILDDVTI